MTTETGFAVVVDDPAREDVRRLVQVHRDWSLQQTPAEFSFSVAADEVADAGITLFAARDGAGRLLGVGGLKELDPAHGEVKTMHVAADARGLGVGRALLEALLREARRRRYSRLSLETGTGASFAAARGLYSSVGFRPSGPFAGYENTEYNVCMSLQLADDGAPA